MLRMILIVLLVFVSPLAYSEYRIEDPQKILDEVNQFIGAVPFEQAFVIEDAMQGETKSCRRVCRNGSCREVCSPAIPFFSEVIGVHSNAVHLLNISGEGDDSSTTTYILTRELYEKVNGNFILLYLLEGLGGARPGDQDFTVIERAVTEDFSLADGTLIPSMKVGLVNHTFDSLSGTYKQEPLGLRVGQGIPAVAQLLEVHKQPDVLVTPLFKVLAHRRKSTP